MQKKNPKPRPLTEDDVQRAKDKMLAIGEVRPTSVMQWLGCPYKWCIERLYAFPQAEATAKGTAIHEAIQRALGTVSDGVAVPTAAWMYPDGYEMVNRTAKGSLVSEKKWCKVWNGITLTGTTDLFVAIDGRRMVYDIKTMHTIESRKIKAYRDSMQFAWYAFLTDADMVTCVPVESREELTTNGDKAWFEGCAYAHVNHIDCCLPVTNPHVGFLETCAEGLTQFWDWLKNGFMPEKKKHYCAWCNAYKSGVCGGVETPKKVTVTQKLTAVISPEEIGNTKEYLKVMADTGCCIEDTY